MQTRKHLAPIHRKVDENYWIGLKYAQSFGFFKERCPHEISLKCSYSLLCDDELDELGFEYDFQIENRQLFPEQFCNHHHPNGGYICAQNDIELLKWIGANGYNYLKESRHILALAAARTVVQAENSSDAKTKTAAVQNTM